MNTNSFKINLPKKIAKIPGGLYNYFLIMFEHADENDFFLTWAKNPEDTPLPELKRMFEHFFNQILYARAYVDNHGGFQRSTIRHIAPNTTISNNNRNNLIEDITKHMNDL